MRNYILTTEAFKSETMRKLWKQLKGDVLFKKTFKEIGKKLAVDLFEVKDEYFKYFPSTEALGKRGDWLKFWFSIEHGFILLTRKNVKLNSNYNITTSSRETIIGKTTTDGFNPREADIDMIRKYADFCLMFNIEQAIKDGIITTDKTTRRKANPPLKLKNEDIKAANVKRYMDILVKKYDFSNSDASLLSLNRIIRLYLGNASYTLQHICTERMMNDGPISNVFSNIKNIISYIDNDESQSDIDYEVERCRNNVKQIINQKNPEITKDEFFKVIESYMTTLNDDAKESVRRKFDTSIGKYLEISKILRDKLLSKNYESMNDVEVTFQILSHIYNLRRTVYPISRILDLVIYYRYSKESPESTDYISTLWSYVNSIGAGELRNLDMIGKTIDKISDIL